LASVGGNRTLAAKILGIDRKTLREKLKHLEPLAS
jgi:DNA-binding protein Fis